MIKSKTISRISYLAEAGMWGLGLLLLATMNPEGEHLFSFCPYSWILESGCPGCGLGHGVSFLLQGKWQASWQAHPLAGPALLLLLYRCWKLIQWHREHFKSLTILKPNG